MMYLSQYGTIRLLKRILFLHRHILTPAFGFHGLRAAMLPESKLSLPFIKPFSFQAWMALIALMAFYSLMLYFLSFLAEKRDPAMSQQHAQFSMLESFLHFFFISIQVSYT